MRVVIVGGGISGLAAAHRLQKDARGSGIGLDCTLVESQGRFGGKVVTRRENGFTIEGGPDSFLTQKPSAYLLCKELGLEGRLIGTNQASKQVYILWKGKLRKLPEGVLLIIPTKFTPFALSTLISPFGKLRMGMDLFIPPKRDGKDESVADFVRRRLGNEALEKIAEPLMGGVHTSDPERQSLLASFPRFSDTERKYGSLIRGMLASKKNGHSNRNGQAPLPTFMTLRGGLAELVETLESHLDGVRMIRGHAVTSVRRGDGGGYDVRLEGGGSLEADAVVLAVPAREASRLVAGLAPCLAEKLAAIRYVSTATVSLGYRKDRISHDLRGFGFVIPSSENRGITGCTWSSTKFDGRAADGYALLRCFLGGATNELPALLPEEEMVRIARAELKAMMEIDAEPEMIHVSRWKDGHPQYDVGHIDRMAEIDSLRTAYPGLHLIGSSYRGVGLPDCIKSGTVAAEAILGTRTTSLV